MHPPPRLCTSGSLFYTTWDTDKEPEQKYIHVYVIGNEKMTLIVQIYKIVFYESTIFAQKFAACLSCIALSITKLWLKQLDYAQQEKSLNVLLPVKNFVVRICPLYVLHHPTKLGSSDLRLLRHVEANRSVFEAFFCLRLKI